MADFDFDLIKEILIYLDTPLSKGDLIDKFKDDTRWSRRYVEHILTKHTNKYWTFTRKAHGAHVFTRLYLYKGISMRKSVVVELIAQILKEMDYTFVIQLDNDTVLDNTVTTIKKKKESKTGMKRFLPYWKNARLIIKDIEVGGMHTFEMAEGMKIGNSQSTFSHIVKEFPGTTWRTQASFDGTKLTVQRKS